MTRDCDWPGLASAALAIIAGSASVALGLAAASMSVTVAMQLIGRPLGPGVTVQVSTPRTEGD